MNKYFKSISNQVSSIGKAYNKISNWGKVLIWFSLFIIIIGFFKSIKNNYVIIKEGFEQLDQFQLKSNADLYDDFYADIYDYLVYNKIKNNYEIGQIINASGATTESIILDIGCGTGHHTGELANKGLDVLGIDISPSMITKSKENYPIGKFEIADALNNNEFKQSSFTHILCLYFTIYYFEDKLLFFNNCMDWLMPGGYLIIHLVSRDKFDPILPPGNPLLIVSPQKYAKKRITNTKIKFTDFAYNADFKFDAKNPIVKFEEKFKHDKNGTVRKNEHTLYMDSQESILSLAQETGFIIQGKIDLTKAQYEYQYLYILCKPN